MSFSSDFKFKGYAVDTKILPVKLDTENPTIWGTVQVWKRKIRQFDYDSKGEFIKDPKLQYKINFHFKILDIMVPFVL